MDSTIFTQGVLTSTQQAILYLIPIVGVLASWIVSILDKLRITPPPKVFASFLVLCGSVALSYWLMPDIAIADRINFLVPQITGGAGMAVLTYETQKTVKSRFSQPGEPH